MSEKPIHVAFCEKKIEKEFEELKSGKYEDGQLYDFIERAISDLKQNPQCGIKIPKKLWPREYVTKYGITNLWKYDLPNGWRLIYTIQTNDVMILNVILEWFSHKVYERRFGY
jgi:Txe/YoeB family toxin of Txe-Axe toxin-antitoxin module